jgi:hypothetical protein
MAFGSRRISLAERSRSSFAFVIFICVQVRIFLLLPATADEGWQWEMQTDEGWVSYWDPQV